MKPSVCLFVVRSAPFSALMLALATVFSTQVFAQNRVVVVPLDATSASVQTFYQTIPAVDFLPTLFSSASATPNIQLGSGEYIVPLSTAAAGVTAPIELPTGAEITQVACYNRDNSSQSFVAANSRFQLWRNGITASGKEDMTAFTSMSTEGMGSSTTPRVHSVSSITNPIIDNQNYFYGLRVLMQINGTPSSNLDLHFLGCRITYLMSVVTP